MKRFDQHWWYVERPFPWPLIVGVVFVVAVTLAFGAWVLW